MTPYKCRQGDVVLVRVVDRGDRRVEDRILPAVVISCDVVNDNLETAVVCPLIKETEISTSRVGAVFVPGELIGMSHDSLMLCLQIFTVYQNQVVQRIGSLPQSLLPQLRNSLKYVLDLDQEG